MDKKPNHICKACGAAYWACNDCDSKKMITWRAVACCPEHFQAYVTLWEYNNQKISKEEARNVLAQFGAGEWVNTPSQKLIDEIFVDTTSNVEKVPSVKKRARKKTEATE